MPKPSKLKGNSLKSTVVLPVTLEHFSVSQVSVPRELVALMSALRDGQEPDPSDSSRVIYRFRQPVSITFFYFLWSVVFPNAVFISSSFSAGPNALLPHCYCCWRFGKQVIFLLLFFLLSSFCFASFDFRTMLIFSYDQPYLHIQHSVVAVVTRGWCISHSHWLANHKKSFIYRKV